MVSRIGSAVLFLLLAGCAPAATQAGRPAPGQDGLHTSYDSATGFTAYVTREARVVASGALETPAPRVMLGANCRGETCVPTEVRFWLVRTAHDVQLQDSYAPLVLQAGGRTLRWENPRYSARPAGVAGTAETVEVILTPDEVRALAVADGVSGRVGLLRDFELDPQGLEIFDLMLGVLGVPPRP